MQVLIIYLTYLVVTLLRVYLVTGLLDTEGKDLGCLCGKRPYSNTDRFTEKRLVNDGILNKMDKPFKVDNNVFVITIS